MSAELQAGLCIDGGRDYWEFVNNANTPSKASSFATRAIEILKDNKNTVVAKGLPKNFERGWRYGVDNGKDLPTAERLVRDYIMTY